MSARSITLAITLALGCAPPSYPESGANTGIYSGCGEANGPTVQAWCSLTQCEYRVEDASVAVFACDGIDCHAAQLRLAAYCGRFCAPDRGDAGPDANVDAWIDLDAGDAGDASDVGIDVGVDAPACLR